MKRSILICLASVLFGVGMLSGQASSGSFYDVDSIQQITITFEQENWRYLLDSLRYNGDDMLLADVEVNGEVFRDVGVRYRDGRSFQPGRKRNGLFIDLDFINTTQAFEGHQTIDLSSALRDPSMLREVMGYELARQYMPAPRANFARVMINEEYYGLFVNVETVDDEFLQNHFGGSEGSLFLSDPNTEEPPPRGCKSGVYGSLQYDNQAKCYLNNFKMYSEKGWDNLIELTRILEEEPGRIGEVLDIDKTLWMLAVNNAIVNLSSYTGRYSPNYFLYQQMDGRFVPIIWDLNLAFGSFKNTEVGSADLSLRAIQRLTPLLHADNEAKPLIHQLLSDDLHQKIYLSHLRTILKQQFDDGRFEERARTLHALIRNAFAEDQNQSYTIEEFDRSLEETIGSRSRIPGLVDFVNERFQYLKRHPELTILPPRITSVEVERRPRFSSDMVTDFKIRADIGKYTRRVYVYYRFQENEEYRQAQMMDDGAHFDGEANDNVYGVRISPEGGEREIQYFIFAENAGAVTFEPTMYMSEPRSANLDELNE
jgi:hypothetical protein